MILLAFIGSLEFYVIAFAVAVALVALIVKPADKGEARTLFARGVMRESDGNTGITLTTDSEGRLEWTRHGVHLDTPDCQVNCAVTVIDGDIKIVERQAVDKLAEVAPCDCDIHFSCLDTLPSGRYHIYYEAAWSGEWASGYVRIPTAIEKRMEMHM